MNRWSALLATILLTAGAAPMPYPSYTYVQPSTPAPERSAASGMSGYTPAPVPDPDMTEPRTGAGEPSHTELTPGIVQPFTTTFQGDGYTPHSTVEGEQQRRFHPAPSLNLSVPLQ